jgi:hypothetical protein
MRISSKTVPGWFKSHYQFRWHQYSLTLYTFGLVRITEMDDDAAIFGAQAVLAKLLTSPRLVGHFQTICHPSPSQLVS